MLTSCPGASSLRHCEQYILLGISYQSGGFCYRSPNGLSRYTQSPKTVSQAFVLGRPLHGSVEEGMSGKKDLERHTPGGPHGT